MDFHSPGHHKAVGGIERANQIFLNKLKKLNNYLDKEWEERVEQATLTYNISYNRAIRTSPFNFNNGKIIISNIDEELGIQNRHLSIYDMMGERENI